ncbi:alpha-ketoacid dehydrogenase subunit beta [Kordiimonas laminariae]|uniref:alpha-ketoacid dehydrogenase subunit beta n=1 Tax=Kordiimonas laminariae TaxID=2917717 RepID=UPI001FF2140E|nr:transketolase C-terminal domain-containing protein [Kordiimonas laminariae]MCK0070345.1 alpha-ketoacid dehydrogenase subunit beta [Kordiimonas laminariae]
MMLSISEALNKAHHQLMEADERVIVMGEDIVGGAGLGKGEGLGGVFGVTSGLVDKFGANRVIDTPISETAFVGMGIGSAMTGLKPIVEVMFCDFMGVCFDQIFNQAAKVRLLSGGRISVPMVIRTTLGAGDSSGAMHSQALHGLLATAPGLKVACPSNPADAAGLLKTALEDDDPVILMEHKGLYSLEGEVADDLPPVPFGEGQVIREGCDITIVAVSRMVHVANQVADVLAQGGGEVEIIDPRTIMPLDMNLILKSVQKTGKLVVVDESFGFAEMVISRVSEEGFGYLKAAPKKVIPLHTPIPYAPGLEQEWLPSEAQIVTAVKELVGE